MMDKIETMQADQKAYQKLNTEKVESIIKNPNLIKSNKEFSEEQEKLL